MVYMSKTYEKEFLSLLQSHTIPLSALLFGLLFSILSSEGIRAPWHYFHALLTFPLGYRSLKRCGRRKLRIAEQFKRVKNFNLFFRLFNAFCFGVYLHNSFSESPIDWLELWVSVPTPAFPPNRGVEEGTLLYLSIFLFVLFLLTSGVSPCTCRDNESLIMTFGGNRDADFLF